MTCRSSSSCKKPRGDTSERSDRNQSKRGRDKSNERSYDKSNDKKKDVSRDKTTVEKPDPGVLTRVNRNAESTRTSMMVAGRTYGV